MSFEKKIRFYNNTEQLEKVLEQFYKEGYARINASEFLYYPGGIRGDDYGDLSFGSRHTYVDDIFGDYHDYEFIEFDESQSAKDVLNPKDMVGSTKLPMNLWSPLATAYGSLGLLNGQKYGFGNYKATPVRLSIYLAAALRHLYAFSEGQENDPIDGCPHLAAILANIAIILEARAVGTLVDDRPLQGGYLKELEKLTEIAKGLNELHKGSTARHYTIADNPDGAIT